MFGKIILRIGKVMEKLVYGTVPIFSVFIDDPDVCRRKLENNCGFFFALRGYFY